MSRRFFAPLALACVATLCSCAVTRAVVALSSSPAPVDRPTHPEQKDARLAVTWVGHATALVQIDDKFVLTDPVFTTTVGQLEKRRIEPGLDPEHLPPVDAVLISRVAFDHLSLGSIADIQAKVRHLLMVEGGTAYLTDVRFPVTELQAWQSWEKDGLRITAVPAGPGVGRYGLDDEWMRTSATGYVVEYHGLTVYFVGDTAYDTKNFVETAEHFPEIDLALLPIGPIAPRDKQRRYHMDPHESVQSFFDLRARFMVPIHYGTFDEGDDRPGDALTQLSRVLSSTRLGERTISPLKVGVPHVFLKKGEEHTPLREPEPKAPKAPSKEPEEKPKTPDEKKNDIPDDERLD